MTRISSIQDKKKKKGGKLRNIGLSLFFMMCKKIKHGTKENTAITSFDDFNGLRTLF